MNPYSAIVKSSDKRMTLQEIAAATGAAYSTVAAYAQRAGWTQNGVQTLLDEKQVAIIVEAMKVAQPNQHSDTFQATLEGIETSQSRAIRINEKRMTLQEIATTTGAAYSTVASYAQRAGWTHNGVQTLLDEKQTTIIIEAMRQGASANHSNDLLSSMEGVETSQSRALRIANLYEAIDRERVAEIAELKAANATLEAQVIEAAPKLEHYDQCMATKDAIPMKDAAAVLNIPGLGRNNLFDKLRGMGILDGKNHPYRRYQDAGYFRVVTIPYKDGHGEQRVYVTTLVLQSGLNYIRRKVANVYTPPDESGW